MGNNAAMTTFEATVIAVYDEGALSERLLDTLASVYSDTDIDLAGLQDLETKDGKHFFQVVVETIQPGVIPSSEPGYEEQGPDWYGAYSEIASERWKFW